MALPLRLPYVLHPSRSRYPSRLDPPPWLSLCLRHFVALPLQPFLHRQMERPRPRAVLQGIQVELVLPVVTVFLTPQLVRLQRDLHHHVSVTNTGLKGSEWLTSRGGYSGTFSLFHSDVVVLPSGRRNSWCSGARGGLVGRLRGRGSRD